MTTPRPFQPAPEWDETSKVCKVCSKSFSLVFRQHHCRNCGGCVCGDHSKASMPLIALGLEKPVRVCDICVEQLKSKGIKHVVSTPSTSSSNPNSTAVNTAVSTTQTSTKSSSDEDLVQTPAPKPKIDCTCGMPLCICEPSSESVEQNQNDEASKSTTVEKKPEPQAKPQPKKTGYNPFNEWNSSSSSTSKDPNERLRDAVKNGDAVTVSNLIKEGVQIEHEDDQGNRALHIAALMSHTAIVKILLEAGATTTCQNHMRETPIQLAGPALAAKIQNFAVDKKFQ